MIEIYKKITSPSRNNSGLNSVQSERGSFRRISRSNNSKDTSRSLSRQSSSSQIAKFYVKNAKMHTVEHSLEIIDLDGIKQKKRQPTPCKSRKIIAHTVANSTQKQKTHGLQSSILVYQLQEKLSHKQLEVEKLVHTLENKQKKIWSLEILVTQNQQKLKLLRIQTNEAKQKIKILQDNLIRNDQCLKSNNNTIEKLKKSIQQNRVQDLRKENDGYKSKINELNKRVQQLIQLNKNSQLKILDLSKEILKFKRQTKLNENFKNESMKQIYLQKEIINLREKIKITSSSDTKQILQCFRKSEQEQICLKNYTNKLMIQLDYLQRMHAKQLLMINQIKSREISKYKLKLTKAQQELRKKHKQEWNGVKKQESKRKILIQKSQNINQCKGVDSIRKLSVSFQLSSDNE